MTDERMAKLLETARRMEVRSYFNVFGDIDIVYVNGVKVKPWHADAVIIQIYREQERLLAWSVARVNGICILRVILRQQKRRASA